MKKLSKILTTLLIGVNLFSSCGPTSTNYEKSASLEEELSQDASDGRIDMPLERASLIVSGITNSDNLDHYSAKIDSILEQFKEDTNYSADQDDFFKGLVLEKWIYHKIGSQFDFNGNQGNNPEVTKAIDAFSNSYIFYDCVALTNLYNILGERVGLQPKAYFNKNHLFSGIETDSGIEFFDPSSIKIDGLPESYTSNAEEVDPMVAIVSSISLENCFANVGIGDTISRMSSISLTANEDPNFLTTLGVCYHQQGDEQQVFIDQFLSYTSALNYFDLALELDSQKISANLQKMIVERKLVGINYNY